MTISLTRLGLKGMLLLITLEVAFLATPYSNLFFALIAWCGVIATLGALRTWRNLAAVEIRRITVAPQAADTRRDVLVQLTASRPCFDVAVEVVIDGAFCELLHLAVLADSLTATVTVPGLPRGIHTWRQARLVSRWPVGLFVGRRRVEVATEVVTWPQPASASARPASSAGRGPHRDDAGAGLRPFRSGDAVADIHWKATARRGQPIVRERSAVDAVELVIDRSCPADELERRLSAATAVVLAARTTGQPVRLRSHDYRADTAAADAVEDVLRWLAGAEAMPPRAAEAAP